MESLAILLLNGYYGITLKLFFKYLCVEKKIPFLMGAVSQTLLPPCEAPEKKWLLLRPHGPVVNFRHWP